jgi:transposase
MVHGAALQRDSPASRASPGLTATTWGPDSSHVSFSRTRGVIDYSTLLSSAATGVQWEPVYYVLAECVTCLLVNAAYVKKVPGRETDVQDCAWLTRLRSTGFGSEASCHRRRSVS